jgi:hypothetical protein
MAFRPNYGQQRSERARQGRSRAEEKQKKLEERSAQRKAAREAAAAGGTAESDMAHDEPEVNAPKQDLS